MFTLLNSKARDPRCDEFSLRRVAEGYAGGGVHLTNQYYVDHNIRIIEGRYGKYEMSDNEKDTKLPFQNQKRDNAKLLQ